MPDYGYGALAPAIGAQEGLAVLLKQRLMERAQKLAELTQHQTAAQREAEMQMRQQEVHASRESNNVYRQAQMDNIAADNERQTKAATQGAYERFAANSPDVTPIPGQYQDVLPVRPETASPGFDAAPGTKGINLPKFRVMGAAPQKPTTTKLLSPDELAQEQGLIKFRAQTASQFRPPSQQITLSPAGADFAANMLLNTGDIPAMGMGAGGRIATVNRAAEINPDANVASIRSEFGANKSALAKATNSYHFKNQFKNQAAMGMANAELTLNDYRPTSRSAILNNMTNWVGRNLTGDPKLSAFEVFVLNTSRDYAKATMGGEASIQQLTDSASTMADRLINSAMGKEQFLGALGSMKQDMENSVTASKNEVAAIAKQISVNSQDGGGKGRSGDDMWDGVSPPRQGQIRVYPNQKRAQFDGTGWVQIGGQ